MTTTQGGGWDTVVRSNQAKAEDLLEQGKHRWGTEGQTMALRAQAYAILALIDTLEYAAAVRTGAVN